MSITSSYDYEIRLLIINLLTFLFQRNIIGYTLL